MKDFIESVIMTGNYRLEDMEERIDKMYVMGKITDEEAVYLKNLAAEKANDAMQIDVSAVLADLEIRIAILESAGVVVWVQGMTTQKGQTVLYDITGDGVLDRVRYDGGRASTSLSPGKISGWVVVDGNGNPTHRIEKDDEGDIILIPIEQTPNE